MATSSVPSSFHKGVLFQLSPRECSGSCEGLDLVGVLAVAHSQLPPLQFQLTRLLAGKKHTTPLPE